MTDTGYFRCFSDHIELCVRLTPKSSRDKLGSIVQIDNRFALQVFVRALPKDGEANTALIAFTAKWLQVPVSSIQLRSGSKSRIKVLSIESDIDRLRQTMTEYETANGHPS